MSRHSGPGAFQALRVRAAGVSASQSWVSGAIGRLGWLLFLRRLHVAQT